MVCTWGRATGCHPCTATEFSLVKVSNLFTECLCRFVTTGWMSQPSQLTTMPYNIKQQRNNTNSINNNVHLTARFLDGARQRWAEGRRGEGGSCHPGVPPVRGVSGPRGRRAKPCRGRWPPLQRRPGQDGHGVGAGQGVPALFHCCWFDFPGVFRFFSMYSQYTNILMD